MEKDPLIEKFFNVVDNAVALNIEYQIKFADSKRYMAAGHWLEEYGTVNINVARQSGKSLYINRRYTPVDLVICMNEDTKRHVFKDCINVDTARELNDVIFKLGDYRGIRNPTEYWNKIYVDEPWSVFQDSRSIKEFYSLVGGQCNQVIMLGTPVH